MTLKKIKRTVYLYRQKILRKVLFLLEKEKKLIFQDDPLAPIRFYAENRLGYDQMYGQANPEIYSNLLNGCIYVYGMGVEGDIAEFGTASGRTASLIAIAMNSLNLHYLDDAERRGNKSLHLFDSFEGLPEVNEGPDSKSSHVIAGTWSKGSCRGLNKEQLASQIARCLPIDKYYLYEGWYSSSVEPVAAEKKFAMLHVDCDLYSSTMDALTPLFEHESISQGCLVLFDDWNCQSARDDLGERLAWRELVKKYTIKFSDEGSYAASGHKFIIHSYDVVNKQ